MHPLIQLLLTAAAVGSAANTIAKATVFAPLRERVARFSPFLGKGIACHYCVSHWLSLVAVLCGPPVPYLEGFGPLQGLVGLFALVTIAAVMTGGGVTWALHERDALEAAALREQVREARHLIQALISGETNVH